MPTPAQKVYGPILIGVMINVLLYGITITQTYLYFDAYKRDRIWLKIFVFVLFLCDTVNTCVYILLLYDELVTGFGNPEVLVQGSVIWATDPATTGVITLLVQLFFAWRVKVLTGSKLIVGVIVIGSLAACFGAIACAVWVAHDHTYADLRKFDSVVIVWLGCASVVDVTITSTLVWYLRKNKTGIPPTDDIVDKIIRLTVQTGLITSVCAILDLSVYLASLPTIHIVFDLALPKLYTNMLMSGLNSRRGWRDDESITKTSDQPNNVRVNVNPQSGHDGGRAATPLIFLGVESHEMADIVDVKGSPYGPGAASTLSIANENTELPRTRLDASENV